MKHWALRIVCGFVLLSGWGTAALAQAALREPAIPGDHPDPTVIRDGDTYWAASTSGGWAPAFPLFRSQGQPDDWGQVGAVFPDPPAWAKGDFWAPELVFDRGRILLYYVARNTSGVLCVAVATAARPRGPYTDHGPLVCQPDGSIDPSFIRSREGRPYLIWKEDANSRQQPTAIWAQRLSPDGLRLQGSRKELIVNDRPWEAGVVEAPFILAHGGWFYLFYAANSCCGAACHYAEGVARARTLLGPWEKDPANPIIHAGNGWRCPGHGTVVQSSGAHPRSWLLLHAYSDAGGVYVAREAVLAPIAWVSGWPAVPGSEVPPANYAPPEFQDSFSSPLGAGWQWPIGKQPDARTGNGKLHLTTSSTLSSAILARVIEGPTYSARILLNSAPTQPAGFAGLAVIGRGGHAVAIGWQQGHVVLWQQNAEGGDVLGRSESTPTLPLELRIQASRPDQPTFSWREPGGKWQGIKSSVSSDSLLGWDSGLRLGVAVSGPEKSTGVFEHYSQSSTER